MRPLRTLLVYVTVVFVGGALLAPWLYNLTQWAGDRSGWLQTLAHNPFHRFVHRSILCVAILGLWPLLRGFEIRSWRDVGLMNTTRLGSRFALGFILGLASLALVTVLALGFGTRKLDDTHHFPEWAWHVFKAGSSGVAVACLEEILFRGVVFGGLRKVMPWQVALGVSSICYAWLHFFQTPASPSAIQWTSGLVQLPQMMHGLVEVEAMVPAFFTLIGIGALLALAYQSTGNLYFSIGLHAGWVFWLKTYNFLTIPINPTPAWFWGTNKLTDGWLALVILAVTGCLMRQWILPPACGEKMAVGDAANKRN